MAEIQVATLSTLRQGMSPVEHGETKLLLVREGDEVRAFEGLCPHARAPLHEGALCQGRIICPWHMGAFDARSGRLLEPVAMRSLKVYPVRLDGDAIIVNLVSAEKGQGESTPDPRLFVVVGGGAAGAMAAVTLRDHGFTGRLVLVEPDIAEPLDRTQLSKMALSSAEFDRGTLPLLDPAQIVVPELERMAACLVAVDPVARRLVFSNGAMLRYDAALLATGAAPAAIDIPGADRPQVCMLRHLTDVDAILRLVRPGGHAVVIGSSFIGMEAASALAERKMTVTVVGEAALPFASQFGDRVGAAIRDLHVAKGVRFRLTARITGIGLDSVELATGEMLSADLVLVGTGVEPVLDYAEALPRAADGGVATDRSLRVAEHLWAAGDIASPEGWPRIEHWRVAQQHGRIAALSMLGVDAAYEGVPFFWTAQHGKRLQYLGHAKDWDEVAYDGSVEDFDFTAWYIKDDKVAAVLVCGRDKVAALLSQCLKSRLSLEEARRAVA